MTEVRKQKTDDYLNAQSLPTDIGTEHADTQSDFCPLSSVLCLLTTGT